jgi:hypothetical protein
MQWVPKVCPYRFPTNLNYLLTLALRSGSIYVSVPISSRRKNARVVYKFYTSESIQLFEILEPEIILKMAHTLLYITYEKVFGLFYF